MSNPWIYFSQLTSNKIKTVLMTSGEADLHFGYSCYGEIKLGNSSAFLYKPNGGESFEVIKYESKAKIQESIRFVVESQIGSHRVL